MHATLSIAVVLWVCVRLTPGRCRGGDLADRLEKAAQQVKTAYSECPSYDVVSGGEARS